MATSLRSLAWAVALLCGVTIARADEPAASVKADDIPQSWATPLKLTGASNAYQVSPRLYRSAQPTVEGMQNFAKSGVKTVVNLRSFHNDREELAGTELKHHHIAMQAWHPEEKEIIAFLKIVTDERQTPVLVHCQHGADRTGMMCAVYRVVVEGWTKQDAIAEMKHARYGFHPLWANLPEWIEKLDIERTRKLAGLLAAAENGSPAASPAVK